jgi:hypothetical protein
VASSQELLSALVSFPSLSLFDSPLIFNSGVFRVLAPGRQCLERWGVGVPLGHP